MLHILWYIIIGFIAGLIAKWIMHVQANVIETIIIGLIGSIVGGLIARLFSKPAEGSSFHPAGFVLSIIGAILILWLGQLTHIIS
jgi:uncharacterized membrane protein YeaQ/YmgE (transglycosylase-associated protein family)